MNISVFGFERKSTFNKIVYAFRAQRTLCQKRYSSRGY